MKQYRTIVGECQHVLEIKHSRFVATAMHVADYDEGLARIAALKKQYIDATHNCYAMVADELGRQCKYSDDGEPSGTAGTPMLEVIKRKGLAQVLVVVTRYFGGIKLGANGLVSAYTQATAEALDKARQTDVLWSRFATVDVDYDVVGKVPQLVRAARGKVLSTDYNTGATLHCVVPQDMADGLEAALVELCKGSVLIAWDKEDWYCYDSDGDR